MFPLTVAKKRRMELAAKEVPLTGNQYYEKHAPGLLRFFRSQGKKRPPHVAQLIVTYRDAEAMLGAGWVRDPAELRRYKEQLWRDNEAVVRRLLGDM